MLRAQRIHEQGRKKKLTGLQLFAHKLCRDIGGFPHPDYLLAYLTWEQFDDWQRCYEQEPWGESRADMRAAANTFWVRLAGANIELPDLIYPYFDQDGDVVERAKLLDAKIAEMKTNAKTPDTDRGV